QVLQPGDSYGSLCTAELRQEADSDGLGGDLPEGVHRAAQNEHAVHEKRVEVDKPVYEVHFDRRAVVHQLELLIALAIVGRDDQSDEAGAAGADKDVDLRPVSRHRVVDVSVIDGIDDVGVHRMD